MERRFELRLEELLEDAVLDPRIPEGMLDRLERFVKPYAAIIGRGLEKGRGGGLGVGRASPSVVSFEAAHI